MSFLSDIALVAILAYIIHAIISWALFKYSRLKTFKKQSVVGPVPSFLTGNLEEYLRWPHTTLDRWYKQYGDTFGYYQGPRPVLVLANTYDVQEVLVKLGRQLPNRQDPFFDVEPFSSSLINLRGERWKHSRRIITPSFTAHKLTMDTSKKCIDEAVKRLLYAIDLQVKKGENVDQVFHMKNVTLDVILRLAFNMNDNDVHEPESEIREMTTKFMMQAASPIMKLAIYFPFLKYVATLAYQLFGGGEMVTVMVKQINQSITEYYQQKIREKFEAKAKLDKKVNILDFMLEQQQQGNLTDLDIIGNAILILLAGFETTANALTYTVYLLAKHPEIQEKLRAELQSMHKPELGHCQFDEQKSELLDRVWTESLRLYPPVVAFVMRELDDNLDQLVLSSGVTIQKGMTVQVPVWSIHHNPDYWPDPYKFDPYRDNLPIGNVKSNAFLAFGAGPRICIGSTLALSEGRAVISSLLLKYRIELASEHPLDPETGLLQLRCPTVVAIPSEPILVKLTPLSK